VACSVEPPPPEATRHRPSLPLTRSLCFVRLKKYRRELPQQKEQKRKSEGFSCGSAAAAIVGGKRRSFPSARGETGATRRIEWTLEVMAAGAATGPWVGIVRDW